MITGKVSDSAGAPLPEVPVRAVRVKDAQGRSTFDVGAPEAVAIGHGWSTDDRGIYRIYGLEAGSYVVSAGGGQGMLSGLLPDPYHSNAPTYYPSNSRATAVEVPVHAGAEAAAIDITYQTAPGHSISGAITGDAPNGSMMDFAVVMLTNAATGSLEGTGMALGNSGLGRVFSLKSLPDGQYYILAVGGFGSRKGAMSDPVKVAVNGADVSGVSLRLAPLPEISGTLSFAPTPKPGPDQKCRPGPETVEDFALTAIKEAGRGERGLPGLAKFFGSEAASPNERGEFQVNLISGGHYHIGAILPGPQYYVTSMKRQGADKSDQTIDASSGVDVKMGEKLNGLSIVVGSDAASITGKVTPAKSGEPLPIDLAVIIIPAQPELSDNLLRYAEVLPNSDGSFKAANLAPGKYFLLIRRLGDRQWNDPDRQPSYWDARHRKELIAEARSRNTVVELKPCDRLEKYSVSYPQPEPSKNEGSVK